MLLAQFLFYDIIKLMYIVKNKKRKENESNIRKRKR